jgi:hypothetical protein
VTVHLQFVSTQVRLVGENVHPVGQDPDDGKARHRVLPIGAHVPLVGLLEYPDGHPAPTCGTGTGRRSSARAATASASRMMTAAPTNCARRREISTAAIKSAKSARVHMLSPLN